MPGLSPSERKIVKTKIAALEAKMAGLPKNHLAELDGIENWRIMLEKLADLMEQLEPL